MRSKTPFLVAFILFSTLLLGAVSGIHISHAATTSDASGYSLNSAQVYNAYGQFEVNETLKGASNSTALNSVTFGFPASYQAHLVMLSTNAELGSNSIQTSVSTNVSNNTLFITLTFAQSLGGANSTVSLGFWVLNALQNINSSGYFQGPVLYSPSANIHLSSLTTIITFPYLTTNIPDTSTMQARGFAQTVSSTSNDQIWNESTTAPNSTLISFPVTIYSNPTSTGSLDFTSIVRQISVDASGKILVEDTLNIQNLGLNTISLLTYTPLTNSGNLTAVPSNEPPLSNVEMIKVTGGQASLNGTNQQIQPDSSATLIFQYPLESQYWKVSGDGYTVTVPTTVPISGIADQYRLYSTSVPGVKITGQPLSLTASGTNQIGSGTASLKFRVGIASATSNALPIAAILFVGVFIAGIVFRPEV